MRHSVLFCGNTGPAHFFGHEGSPAHRLRVFYCVWVGDWNHCLFSDSDVGRADCDCLVIDGSGADNFYDAGSCIDGRLTSAWNWCEKWQGKGYANVMRVCGVTGFSDTFEK